MTHPSRKHAHLPGVPACCLVPIPLDLSQCPSTMPFRTLAELEQVLEEEALEIENLYYKQLQNWSVRDHTYAVIYARLDYWYPVLIKISGLRKPQPDSLVSPTPPLTDEEQIQEFKDIIWTLQNSQDLTEQHPAYAIAYARITYLFPDLAELFPRPELSKIMQDVFLPPFKFFHASTLPTLSVSPVPYASSPPSIPPSPPIQQFRPCPAKLVSPSPRLPSTSHRQPSRSMYMATPSHSRSPPAPLASIDSIVHCPHPSRSPPTLSSHVRVASPQGPCPLPSLPRANFASVLLSLPSPTIQAICFPNISSTIPPLFSLESLPQPSPPSTTLNFSPTPLPSPAFDSPPVPASSDSLLLLSPLPILDDTLASLSPSPVLLTPPHPLLPLPTPAQVQAKDKIKMAFPSTPDSSPVSSQFLASTIRASSAAANPSPVSLPSSPHAFRISPTSSLSHSVPLLSSTSPLSELTLPQHSSLAIMSPHTAKVTNKNHSKQEQEYFPKLNQYDTAPITNPQQTREPRNTSDNSNNSLLSLEHQTFDNSNPDNSNPDNKDNDNNYDDLIMYNPGNKSDLSNHNCGGEDFESNTEDTSMCDNNNNTSSNNNNSDNTDSSSDDEYIMYDPGGIGTSSVAAA